MCVISCSSSFTVVEATSLNLVLTVEAGCQNVRLLLKLPKKKIRILKCGNLSIIKTSDGFTQNMSTQECTLRKLREIRLLRLEILWPLCQIPKEVSIFFIARVAWPDLKFDLGQNTKGVRSIGNIFIQMLKINSSFKIMTNLPHLFFNWLQ